MVTLENIKIGEIYLEHIIDPDLLEEDDIPIEVLILAKDEEDIFLILYPQNYNEEFINKLKSTQDPEELFKIDGGNGDDDIIQLTWVNGRFETCLGYEIIFTELK